MFTPIAELRQCPPRTFNGDLESLPSALSPLCEEHRWVGWKWTLDKRERWTKPPYRVDQPGSHADNSKPDTWGSYQRGVDAVLAGKLDGIGFVLTGTKVGALDLDNCRDSQTGVIDAWAQGILDRASDAYQEVTVSGTGLRIIGTTSGKDTHRKFSIPNAREGAAVELYRNATRYITISGNEIGSCPQLPNIDDLIDAVLAERGGQNGKGFDFSADTRKTADSVGGKDEIEDIIKNGAPESTRSEKFARVIWSLAGRGLSVDEIDKRLRKHPNGIAEKYWPRLHEEIERCFSKWRSAQDESDSNDLADLNKNFAVVTVGSNVRIMTMTTEPTFYRVADFKLLLQNRYKLVPYSNKPVTLPTWWLNHPQRRQYNGVVFEPGGPENVNGNFNLWTGFAFEPQAGDCSLYLTLLRDVICNGDEVHYNYLLNLMADTVQRLNKQGEVAVVLRGVEGIGKGFAIRKFGTLFGPHFTHVSQASHLVGKFNAHLSRCSILYADEAFFAGDRQHEATLKALITEPTFMVERKGMDVVEAPNRVHLWVSSNEDWVVPAGSTARRFFVLVVPDTRRNDVEYFTAIDRQMRNGGYEALLHTLQNRDLSGFDIRQVPQTAALAEQKALTRRGVDALVEWVATEGVLPCPGPTGDIAVTSAPDAKETFYEVAKKRLPGLQYLTPPIITKALTKHWGCKPWHSGKRRGVRFPDLTDLRKKCEAKFGPIDWPHDEGHWPHDGDGWSY